MQERILRAIKGYIKAHGYPPTVREIGYMVGLRSSSSVQHYLSRMLEEGSLETDEPSSARALRVPGMRVIFEGEEDKT